MVKLEQRIFVHAPVENVFEYMSRFENDPQWRDEVVDSVRTAPVGHGIGERYEQLMSVEGHEIQAAFEVTEYEANRRLGFRGTSGDVSAIGSYDFSSTGVGTSIDIQAEIRVSGALEATEPYIMDVVARAGKGDFARLQELLDTEPGT